MKYLNLLFSIIFIASAYLQLNDADPLLWVVIYLSGAILCILSIFRKVSAPLLLIALLAYLLYAVILFTSRDGVWVWLTDYKAENIAQSMKATKPWIENTREFFGLIMLATVTGLNLIQQRRKLISNMTNNERH